ncbi:DNA (cytosine-5)-methyltransferase 1 [Pseudacidovorax sp. 1753]|uniref:DNA cytosine methyltransferase n=1 Tax=Pseudacidovorax sp. 1753 TaxID=3156419 RepID=UPI003393B009
MTHVLGRPLAIDLFSGCGGLTRGLKDAGFKVLAAVEIDAKAQQTYLLNHPDVCLYKNDIRLISAEQLMEDCSINVGQLDLLAGCPPCQGFSRLRTKNRAVSVHDDRNTLIKEFLRLVLELRPKTIMMENVPSLKDDIGFVEMVRQISRAGYRTNVEVLNAADYGVPQRRRRLIFLASRVGAPQVAPKAKTRLTVRDAIGSLEAPSRSKDPLHAFPENRSQSVKDLIAKIPKNGGSRAELGNDHQLPCHRRSDGFRDVYGRMAWDDVAPTITGGCHAPSKGRFLHPSYNRTVTLREAALLQGFPREYRFDTSHGKESIALMIGNALPPPLIAAQAQSLKNTLIASQASGASKP